MTNYMSPAWALSRYDPFQYHAVRRISALGMLYRVASTLADHTLCGLPEMHLWPCRAVTEWTPTEFPVCEQCHASVMVALMEGTL